MGLCETTVEGNGLTLDLSTLSKEELAMEIIRQSEAVDKLRRQRDMLQTELLKLHRRDL